MNHREEREAGRSGDKKPDEKGGSRLKKRGSVCNQRQSIPYEARYSIAQKFEFVYIYFFELGKVSWFFLRPADGGATARSF